MAEFKNNIGEFNYSLSGNFTTLQNEVTYLNPSIQRILGGQSSGAATFLQLLKKDCQYGISEDIRLMELIWQQARPILLIRMRMDLSTRMTGYL